MKHYDLVVLGSGYYSVGLAVGVGNALVVDEQYLVDPVFYGTLSGFAPTPCKDFQGLEAEIGTHFAEPSFRVDERLNICAAEMLLAEYVKKNNVDMLLGAVKVGIGIEGKDYIVTLHTTSGEVKVAARSIVEIPYHKPDTLRFLVRGDIARFTDVTHRDAEISASDAFRDGEFILTVKLPEPLPPEQLTARATRIAADIVSSSEALIVTVAENGFSSDFPPSVLGPIGEFARGKDDARRIVS